MNLLKSLAIGRGDRSRSFFVTSTLIAGLGIAIFVFVAGFDEFTLLDEGAPIQDGKGVWHAQTRAEIRARTLFLMLKSFPFAVVSVGFFLRVGFVFKPIDDRRNFLLRVIACALLGLYCGTALSIFYWFVFGGWGPILLRPAVIVGSVVIPSVAASSRIASLVGLARGSTHPTG